MPHDTDPRPFDALADDFRQVLATAGFHGSATPPASRSSGRPLAVSPQAFELFAAMKGAPEVLATIAAFADAADLRDADDFAVSCLPSGSPPRGRTRAAAISVGMVEVLAIEVERATGRITAIALWSEAMDLTDLAARTGWEWHLSGLDGGGSALLVPGRDVPAAFADPQVRHQVASRVAGIRARRRRFRRMRWHNPWLWELVDTVAHGETASEADAAGDDWDVTAADVLRVVRNRTSQGAFRQRLLTAAAATGGAACAICALDVVAVLEAAHLVAHARGGRASSDNGRLLCANHHRAFDAGLYAWTGDEFVWTGRDLEPVLGGR